MTKRTNKRTAKTADISATKTATKTAVDVAYTGLIIDQWFAANPDAPPVDTTTTVGARNYGRYSGKKCREWQRWIQTDCRDDQRTDDEIADAGTLEFAASSHVISHAGRFPVATVRAMRREYNAGQRGRIVNGPVPEWRKGTDGVRTGVVRLRDANGKWVETPYPAP